MPNPNQTIPGPDLYGTKPAEAPNPQADPASLLGRSAASKSSLIAEAFPDLAAGAPEAMAAAPGASEVAAAAVAAGGAAAAPEAAAAALGLGSAVAPVAAVVGGYTAMKGIADAAETQGSISQFLIASGGSRQSDSAPIGAILGAINRLAGFKSRM